MEVHQHSQQLDHAQQLEELDTLNQQIQQQVMRQRELRSQNQPNLANPEELERILMTQNDPTVFQQQFADLQQNIALLQQVERQVADSSANPEFAPILRPKLALLRQKLARLEEMEQRILTHQENRNLG